MCMDGRQFHSVQPVFDKLISHYFTGSWVFATTSRRATGVTAPPQAGRPAKSRHFIVTAKVGVHDSVVQRSNSHVSGQYVRPPGQYSASEASAFTPPPHP